MDSPKRSAVARPSLATGSAGLCRRPHGHRRARPLGLICPTVAVAFTAVGRLHAWAPARAVVQPVVGGLAVLIVSPLVRAVSSRIRRLRRPEARSIRVIGVGGAGSNAVDRMLAERVRGVDFIACNTDAQALRRSRAPRKLRIGHDITGGLGSGGDPEVGRRSAEDDADRISRALEGADLVFVTAGLGGGTGSGAAPVVAARAREQGALTIGVVTKPFGFEGSGRERIAEEAARSLMSQVDALIAIPNDRMSDVVQDDATMLDAFRVVDGVLLQGIEGILQLLDKPELINLDFADVRAVLQHAGPTLIGLGRGSGEHRATDAAREAVSSPLLEAKIDGARTILFNVSGPADLQLREVREAADEIRAAADPNATVIFGAGFGEPVGDDVRITLIATGLAGSAPDAQPAEEPAATPTAGVPAPPPGARRATRGAVPAPRGSRTARGRKAAEAAPEEPGTDAGPAEPVPPAGAAERRSVLDDDEYEVPSFLRRGTKTPTGGQS